MNIDKTLDERGTRYGKFKDQAMICQALKEVMQMTEGWDRLAPDQAEALEMIQHKVARVLNGDCNYIENFRDIAGYATLVSKRLYETDGATDVTVTRTVRRNGEWVDE